MKLETIAKRVSLAREAKAIYLLPHDNFLEKISSAAKLLDFVEKKKADKKIKLEARKYFVIACTSAMETYFKRMAWVFIDNKWINDDFMDILKQDKISLADLLEINKKELSLGEIISVSHSFQDLESINRIYSKMLGVTDFIEEVEAFETKVKKGKRVILKNNYSDFRKKIGELLNLRHLIIHHEGFKGLLGLQRLVEMWENLDAFVAAADNYLMEKMPED